MITKKKRILFVVGIAIFVCCIFAGSYAFWTVTKEQTDSNLISSGCFNIAYQEESEKINLNNLYPITNEEGNALTPYVFTIQNNCTTDAKYNVYFDVSNTSTMLDSSISTSLNGTSIKLLTGYETEGNALAEGIRESYKLTSGTLTKSKSKNGNDGESKTYELRIWIDENAPISEAEKTFSGKVRIEASPITIEEKDISIPAPPSKLIVSVDVSDKYDCDKNACTPAEGTNNVTLSWYDNNTLYFTGTGKVERPHDYNNEPDDANSDDFLIILLNEKYKNNSLYTANIDFINSIIVNCTMENDSKEGGNEAYVPFEKYKALKNNGISDKDFVFYLVSNGMFTSYSDAMSYFEANGITFNEAFADSEWNNVTEETFPNLTNLFKDMFECIYKWKNNMTNIYFGKGITEIPEIKGINLFGSTPANIYFSKSVSYLGQVRDTKANLIFPTNLNEDDINRENLSLSLSEFIFDGFKGSVIFPNYLITDFSEISSSGFDDTIFTKISFPDNNMYKTIDFTKLFTKLGQNNPDFDHGGNLSNTNIEFRGELNCQCGNGISCENIVTGCNLPEVGTKETNPTITFLKRPNISSNINMYYNNNSCDYVDNGGK